jgi:amino acid transporter
MPPAAMPPAPGRTHAFGTFAGVFAPTLLTILGVILFLRANFIVGHAGIINALLILGGCQIIVLLTAMSISAISTNSEVRGGGAYFLISRSLGPEFGGAIGVTLFLAQALSVPFYVLGFTEALVAAVPSLREHFQSVSLVLATVLFVIAYLGAHWAVRLQYVVLAILALAIVSFLGGAALGFDSETFRANLEPASSETRFTPGFWILFAIYFPAVTGIMTGVNMSGDLKDPAVSIPRGTFWAVLVSAVIYGVHILLCGGALQRENMIAAPYESLLGLSLFGAGFIVAAGVFAATVSSAIGSLVAAPRVLQALARDEIFAPIRVFARGTPGADEPRRAMCLTFAITLGVLWAAGDSEDGLNQVAAIVSMFFLAAYGVTNGAAFIEAVGANPSFRPRFRWFHWTGGLLGGLGCIAVAVLVDWVAALVATGFIVALWFYVAQRGLSASFGDARRGFVYTRARNNLLRLQELPSDPKNWRPTVLVLTGNPHTRLRLVKYALWLEARRGVVTLAQILVGDLHELADERRRAMEDLAGFIEEEQLPAFPETVVVPEFDAGLRIVLQAHSIGPIKPNLVLFGWSAERERAPAFVGHMRCGAEIGKSLLILANRARPVPRRRKRIDVWWRGRENGSLMLILAHLLMGNPEWQYTRIRVLRVVDREDEKQAAEAELTSIIDAARIHGWAEVVVSDRPFSEILHDASTDATLVLLGFFLPPPGEEQALHDRYTALLEGLPTTLLVNSSGDADLLA